MKKILLFLMTLIGGLNAFADSYPYLTFETTDGDRVSVAVESLTLTISGNTLTVDSQSFTLSNLAKMYFSDTDETETGIESIQNSKSKIQDEIDDAEIYDLKGNKIVNGKLSNCNLSRGIYLVKTKQETYKIVVK